MNLILVGAIVGGVIGTVFELLKGRPFLCSILDHKWTLHVVAGDHGEPAENQCRRCHVTTPVVGLCRCVVPCDCVETTLPSGHRWKLNIPKGSVFVSP